MTRAATDLWGRIVRFVERDLWDINLGPVTTFKRVLLIELRVLFLTAVGVKRHDLPLRAAALTYITVFSLVPTLAVGFSMFMAFGEFDRAMDMLMPKILDYLAVGTRGTVQQQLQHFIENIHGAALGSVGALVLGVSVLSLLTNMERALNVVWGVKRDRTLLQRIPLYWTMATVMPMLVLAGVVLSASVRNLPVFQWVLERPGVSLLLSSVLPLAIVSAGFAFLYAAMPNTRVSLRAALIGGLVGGVLWSAAVYGYAFYAARAVRYATIYGSLGALPLFLLWIYLSWLIVLIGAEVGFAHEHVRTYGEKLRAREASQASQRLLGLRIQCEAARRFLRAEDAPTPGSLADHLEASSVLVVELVGRLIDAGLLVRSEAGEGLIPGRDPRATHPTDVLSALDPSDSNGAEPPDRAGRLLRRRASEAEAAARDVWNRASIAELALADDAERPEGS